MINKQIDWSKLFIPFIIILWKFEYLPKMASSSFSLGGITNNLNLGIV